eukprot:1937306-Pyramimonas_sp.AAC.1
MVGRAVAPSAPPHNSQRKQHLPSSSFCPSFPSSSKAHLDANARGVSTARVRIELNIYPLWPPSQTRA